MQPPAVAAWNLARRYGRRWALADVSFELARGAVMMVSGRNGSGKTTLLRILSTAIHPDAGKASVGGYDVRKQRDEIRRSTALLSHYSYLYESLSARENLDIVARFRGLPPDSAAASLDRVGLGERANDVVSTFSAGMRKRLSFARVLMQKPSIAFLDEPFGQLDPEGFVLIEQVVAELKSSGATVIIATHQVERVERFADVHLALENGRVQ